MIKLQFPHKPVTYNRCIGLYLFKKLLTSKTEFDSFVGRLTLLGYDHKLLATRQSWKIKLSLF